MAAPRKPHRPTSPAAPATPRQRPKSRIPRPERSAANAEHPSGEASPRRKAHSSGEASPGRRKAQSNGEANSTTNADPGWIAPILRLARERGETRAAALRSRFPDATPRQLGERCVASSATRAGLLGAATGTLALVALPVGLPAGIAVTLLLEAELLFTLIALYRLPTNGEVGRLRLYAVWVGAGFADAAKTAGVRLGANAVRRVLSGSLPARIIARINPVLLRAILRRLGLGWLPRALKMWPLLGAPVGFALDRSALRVLGFAALDTLEGASTT
jgi:hypothetical protein